MWSFKTILYSNMEGTTKMSNFTDLQALHPKATVITSGASL